MELGIHNWMRSETIETTMRRVAALGYTQLEIAGTPEHYDTKQLRKLMQEHGLSCWGAVTLMLGDRNLLARDEAQRGRSVQYVKDVIKMVKELDGHMVAVVPCTVGKIVPDGRPDEEWKWAVNALKEIYDYSEASGIRIGIEPINRFETYFINRADQALALAEATGPNCGICLDTFHMNIEEADMFEAIKKAKGKLAGFHVADNNRMAPGMGNLNWRKIIDTLKEINYNEVLSVEFCASLDRTPANPYPDSIDENPENLSAEQAKFLVDHGSASVTEEFYTMLTTQSFNTLSKLI
ncbi:sugar phosphate isomerase/epimerase family protein [Chitinophaga ginsengisegetis]|uniref:sugar phosphate isomerase/epimerase family protein n=1 Tax=Chitinophaga ginsengisegetis TaxID=393003 RepID=UPI000DB93052|nr:sugar phosphate isomerase/epimerase family protein [Chitinophaga ginsengisegetis]MDR6571076.1 sugar phosphate isomerase/epimerase [Chitinophaga ginsengisegetis]MDR6650810.1 sugar phosphate isomerase/epimerase [Chitinophaga ginsengisegetis]MDR6657170.1 sugar phosphate isomerase/epimerase [Chitinophaga ginsengisegetis]